MAEHREELEAERRREHAEWMAESRRNREQIRATIAQNRRRLEGKQRADAGSDQSQLCLWLEEHERATLEDVALLVSNLRSLATPKDHGSALAILRKATGA